jgi:fucose permease
MLGLAESGLGTAWPTLRLDAGRPISDLGVLLAAGLVGYSSSSALSGRVARRIGMGPAVLTAAATSLAGLGLFVVSSGWVPIIAAAVTLGVGGGLLDSSINAYAAHRFSAGATNLLHAGFGIGATLGPIVMARAVASGAGWHAGYLVIAVAQALLLAVLWITRARWRPVAAPETAPYEAVRLDVVVVLSLAMFFLYTGVEVAAGQWSFSVLSESRGLGTDAAGLWVAAYWGGLTVGRLGLSGVASRLGPRRVLGLSMAGTVAGCALFWWDPGGLGVVGLPFAGLSLAGVFPTLVTLTPQRIGAGRTTAVMGYQLAAASLGAATLPWVVGHTVARTSLEALGPMLVGAAVVMAALHAVLDGRSGRLPASSG